MSPAEPGSFVELDEQRCLSYARSRTFGRVSVVVDGYPMTFPVSYRLATREGEVEPVVVIRATPSSTVGSHLGPACFEVDDVDPYRRSAWSVLFVGNLEPVEAIGLEQPDPWVPDRHQWLMLRPLRTSGRLVAGIPERPESSGYDVAWQLAEAL